jgi:hypothetical protein
MRNGECGMGNPGASVGGQAQLLLHSHGLDESGLASFSVFSGLMVFSRQGGL